MEEAIQLSLALEESERYAKEEAAMRSKLQVMLFSSSMFFCTALPRLSRCTSSLISITVITYTPPLSCTSLESVPLPVGHHLCSAVSGS